MADNSRIGWCDATWNPVYGCSEVSPGCDNCYARTQMERFRKPWRVTRATEVRFDAPLHWKRPRRIFVCSMGDLFHPRVETAWLESIWRIMCLADWHTFLLLTKRPGRMAAWAHGSAQFRSHPWPAHIWAGTSVETAKYLPRLDVLARVPAKVRFVSFEPLLGPMRHLDTYIGLPARLGKPCVHWVIVGGESGAEHRTMSLVGLGNIVDTCMQADVPVFVKQDSGRYPGKQGRIPACLWAMKEMP